MNEPDDRADGVTVFSKYPIRNARRIAPQDKGGFTACCSRSNRPVARASIKRPLAAADQLSQQGDGYFTVEPIHVREVQALDKFLDPSLPTLVVGDFNEGNTGKATRWLATNRDLIDALPEFDFHSPTFHGPVAGVPITGAS
jgi:hypothetical protein